MARVAPVFEYSVLKMCDNMAFKMMERPEMY